jgi:phosphoribosyl-ATP pyrophosphohydrolase
MAKSLKKKPAKRQKRPPRQPARVPAQPGTAADEPHSSLPAPESASAVLDRLFAVVMERRTADPAVSHSARLLSRGIGKVAQKFGEEAVECLIESVAGNPDAVIAESADVLYHLIVLWVASGVRPDQVWSELIRREGVSGIAEKASRVRNARVAFSLNTTKIP